MASSTPGVPYASVAGCSVSVDAQAFAGCSALALRSAPIQPDLLGAGPAPGHRRPGNRARSLRRPP